ncbi:non-ribosomal peptide synthetase [Nocardiopsis terrae]
MKECPDADAVHDPGSGRTLTYGDLWERSGWLAARLSALGVGRGDSVALAQDRSVELVVSYLGVLRTGAAYVPLDRAAPAPRIDGILTEAGVEVLVHSDRDGAGSAPWRGAGSSVRWVAVPTERPADHPVPEYDPDPSETAYICYTSGSTGRPKGVRVPHRAVSRLVHEPNFCVIAPGDRVSNLANPAFDFTTFEIWNTLTSGGTVVVLPSLLDVGVEEWAATVVEQRIDVLSVPTAVFHTLARERPDAFALVPTVVVAGEQLDITAARRVLAEGAPKSLVNAYGPTEATTFASFHECTGGGLDGLDRVPVGVPIQHTTLFLLDEHLAPVADGAEGELCIGGPGVADGYLDRPELTADRFVLSADGSERLYRTGDLARRLPGGAIELLGRRDRQVKLRGFRVELEEVERCAAATGAVDSVFVEKAGDGESAVLVGFVLPARGVEFSPEALSRALGEHLPAYMLPARWVLLDAVPLGSTGKVDRNRLLALLDTAAGADQGDGGREQPAGADPDVVEEVRRIWCEAFDRQDVNASDNFIELGGESVLAAEVAARLQEQIDPGTDAARVLLSDSLAELAASLRSTVREGNR